MLDLATWALGWAILAALVILAIAHGDAPLWSFFL